MLTHGPIRALLVAFSWLISGLLLLGAIALVVNLSWFDATLHPDLERLKNVEPLSVADNAYPIALGFAAADGMDPRAAGENILKALHGRFLHGGPITLNAEEMNALLGRTAKSDTWQNRFGSLDCNARVDLDCAERLVAEVTQSDAEDARLAVLLSRYESMIREKHFIESQERDVFTPGPPYGQIRGTGRLRLAMSLQQNSASDVLIKAAEDFRFWTNMLREGSTLVAKMVALAGMQDTLDFVSALMRQRELSETEIQAIHHFLRPLTAEELDIGEAFTSEARVAVLSDTPPVAMDSPWFIQWTLQKNATLNDMYSEIIIPMKFRSAMTPEAFFKQGAYKPLNHDLGELPLSLFNWGGHMAFRNASWDPEQFVARTQDQNGRISLVMLQVELEQKPGADIGTLLSLSRWRNPYTGEPMKYDAASHTIGFTCLHTAYHPPALPDKCSVAIGPRVE